MIGYPILTDKELSDVQSQQSEDIPPPSVRKPQKRLLTQFIADLAQRSHSNIVQKY
tara:strand:- start:2839 stop:3006 length:168 start_codon:yes stop_codon:yes gene_type:complete